MKNIFILLFFIAIASTQASAQTEKAKDTTLPGFPVLRSYVAPDVVERAKKKYGRPLYSIEKTLAANCENSYLVGLIRNGKLTMDWMCDDPKMVFHVPATGFSYPVAAR